MTTDSMSKSHDMLLTVSQTQKTKTVEGRLLSMTLALAATECNIYLLSTLKKLGLATNDIKSFVEKQTINRKAKFGVDAKVRRSAMQSKIIDACAYAKRLRQDRNTLKKRVLTKYRNTVAKGRRIIDEIHKKYLSSKSVGLETCC